MLKFAAVVAVAMGLATQIPVLAADAPAATNPAPVAKVGNTKCPVSGEEMMGKGCQVVFEGKEYNLCCKDCKADWDKDPAKYVKILEKDPAKYGVPAAKPDEKK